MNLVSVLSVPGGKIMLIKGCHKEFVRPPNPEAEHLRSIAHLDVEISRELAHEQTAKGSIRLNG